VIDSAENLMRRAKVMTRYATGVRCSELCHLKVSEIDSKRMAIHRFRELFGLRVFSLPVDVCTLNPS
jgi:integrase